MPIRQGLVGKRWVIAVLMACGLGAGSLAAIPAGAAEVSRDTVSGYLYRDLDNDGIRDANEPPVPDVVIRSGRRATITDAAGYYAFTGLTEQVNVRVDTAGFAASARRRTRDPRQEPDTR